MGKEWLLKYRMRLVLLFAIRTTFDLVLRLIDFRR